MHAISVVLKVTYYTCPTEGIARAITFLQHTSHGMSLFTGRNEVVAKVMFLHVSVILSTGGSPGRENPPWTREIPPPRTREKPPPRPGRSPPDQGEPPPPQTRENPPGPGRPPPDQEDLLDQADPPPRKQTPEYGLRAPVRILLECILV